MRTHCGFFSGFVFKDHVVSFDTEPQVVKGVNKVTENILKYCKNTDTVDSVDAASVVD